MPNLIQALIARCTAITFLSQPFFLLFCFQFRLDLGHPATVHMLCIYSRFLQSNDIFLNQGGCLIWIVLHYHSKIAKLYL